MSQNDDQNKNLSEEQLAQASQSIFARLNAHEMSAGPYLKTRVLAREREMQSRRRTLNLWRGLALTSFAMVLAFAAITFFYQQRYDALVNQTVAIHLDSGKLGADLQRVAFIRIEVPSGVRFESKSFPEISQLEALTFAWKPGRSLDKIPVLVRASEDGEKQVHVSFLDQDHRVVGTDEVHIRFKADGRNSASSVGGGV